MNINKTDILISTVIPCFNCELYIEETITSVTNQTHKNIEIICIDNNSTDNTWDLLCNLQKKHDFIKLFKEKKKGANYARNLGLENATGKYIQFLDSDDVIDKYKFEKQVQYLLNNKKDLVVSDRKVLDSKLDKVLETIEFQGIEDNLLETAITKIIITGNPLYNTQIIKNIGGYLGSLESAQDWEFHIRLFLKTSNVGYLPGYFLLSRNLKNSLSSNIIKVSNSACDIIKQFKPQFIEKKLFLNDNIMRKITSVLLESYINSKKPKKEDYKKELVYWNSTNKNIFTGKLAIINSIFGIKSFLFFKNLAHKFKTN